MRNNNTNRLLKNVSIILAVFTLSFLGWVTLGNCDEANTWNPVHELYVGNFGVANEERDRLVAEYELIISLAKDWNEAWSELKVNDSGLDAKLVVLRRERGYIDRGIKGVETAIRLFVNSHRGI